VTPPPSPPRFWGRGTLAGEREVGRVPIPTRGHTLWYSLYTYFVVTLLFLQQSSDEGATEVLLARDSSSERLNKVKRRFQRVLSQHDPGNLPAVQRARPNQVTSRATCQPSRGPGLTR
jgi:hypothetical protein